MSPLPTRGSALLVASCLLAAAVQPARAEDLLLGVYGPANAASLDAVAGTAIDHIIPSGIENMEETTIRSFLDAAASKNIKIIFSLKDAFKESKWYPGIDWCPTQDEAALVACIATKFAAHEAVGGWYLCDEPTNLLGRFKGDKLRANAGGIRAVSKKPIFAEEVALPRGKHWDLLDEVADRLLVTAYPVPDKPLSDAFTRVAALGERHRKPVVAVIQAFDKNNVPYFKSQGVAGRPPLYEEERVMSYLSLLAGAQGIVYYSLPELKKITDWQARLGRLAELGAELKKNYPLIRSTARLLLRYTVAADEGVYHAITNSGGADQIIAVNATASLKTVRIEWEDASGKRGARTIPLGALEVRLAAIAGLK